MRAFEPDHMIGKLIRNRFGGSLYGDYKSDTDCTDFDFEVEIN